MITRAVVRVRVKLEFPSVSLLALVVSCAIIYLFGCLEFAATTASGFEEPKPVKYECGRLGHNFVSDERISSPWTALLFVDPEHGRPPKAATAEVIGQGAIIGPYTVLVLSWGLQTPNPVRLRPSKFLIGVGIKNSTDFSRRDNFAQLLEPQYIYSRTGNLKVGTSVGVGLAVVQLKSAIVFSLRVRPICIENGTASLLGQPKFLSGFESDGFLNMIKLDADWSWYEGNCSDGSLDPIGMLPGAMFGVWSENRWYLTGLTKIHWLVLDARCKLGFRAVVHQIEADDLGWIQATIRSGNRNLFTCFTGESIPLSKVCNGQLDCSGQMGTPSAVTDEEALFCAGSNCPANPSVTECVPRVSHTQTSSVPNNACGRRPIGTGLRILNGSQAASAAWPWHVALFKFANTSASAGRKDPVPKYICGATLISSDALLTAAHCVTHPGTAFVERPSYFRAVLNPTSSDFAKNFDQGSSSATILANITSIHVHENYYPATYEADIAVLKLSNEFWLTSRPRARPHVQLYPVCIPSSTRESELTERRQTRVGSVGTVLGFGVDDSSQISPHLQVGHLPIVSPQECQEVSSLFPSVAQICAGATGTSVCHGDSGGGLVFPDTMGNGDGDWRRRGSYIIQGIVSHGSRDRGEGRCRLRSKQTLNFYTCRRLQVLDLGVAQ